MKTILTSKLNLFLMLCLIHLPGLAQTFQANVDRNVVELGDTVNLSFTYTANANSQTPDFGSLRNNFDILSYQPSYSEINNNGRQIKLSSWEMIVEPKHTGKILIPAISFLGQTSNAIELTVNTPSSTLDPSKELFLETIIDKSSAYVQEQIKVTYRLYYTIQIEAEPEAPQLNDAVVKQLETKQYQRRVNGKLYRVAEVPFIVFAQRSGTAVIPSTTWQVRVAKAGSRPSLLGGFGRYELRKLRSQEKVIRIKPIPDSYPSSATWLPARSVKASDAWSTNRLDQLVLGEPITRTIKLEGQGIESAQIPAVLSDAPITGLKTYLEPPQLSDELNDSGVFGVRTESAAVVMSQNIETNIPEITIPWWNTETDSLEIITIPSQTLSAQAAVNRGLTQEAPIISLPNEAVLQQEQSSSQLDKALEIQNSNSSVGWYVWALGISNIVLIAIVIWLLLRRKAQAVSVQDEHFSLELDRSWKARTNALKVANAEKNTTKIYEILQKIAKEDLSLSGIQALKIRLQNSESTELSDYVKTIEQSLYGQAEVESEAFEVDVLITGLKKLLDSKNEEKTLAADGLVVL